MQANFRNISKSIDYNFHGLVGIRLLNASPEDALVVQRQLGPIHAPLNGKPDIIIRFVDLLPTSSKIRYLGLDDVGFTEDSFLLLNRRPNSRVKVQIAFEGIGEQCEIVCERGLSSVPLLIPILNLTMLAKGALPLHASAFNYNGIGVLTTGWEKGGKTEALLAFLSNGADYVGDEWVYLSCDNKRMYGFPQPITLWDWHLQDQPRYRAYVGRADLARLWTFKFLTQSITWAISSGFGRGTSLAKYIEGASLLLRQQLYVHVPPEKLFGKGDGSLEGSLDKIFFVVSQESPEVTVQPIGSQEIARRMVYSLQYERIRFLSYYLKFRFAFPDAMSGLLERVERLEMESLIQVLADKETYAVYHPYPVSIQSLFDAMSPYCG